MPREVWPVVAAHWSRPGYYAGMQRHVEAVPDTVREMQDAEPIREIPVLVLTPGKVDPALRSVPGKDREQCATGNCDRKARIGFISTSRNWWSTRFARW